MPVSDVGPYYRIDSSPPILEFSVPNQTAWDGRPALTQGRLYTYAYRDHAALRTWYEALVGGYERASQRTHLDVGIRSAGRLSMVREWGPSNAYLPATGEPGMAGADQRTTPNTVNVHLGCADLPKGHEDQ